MKENVILNKTFAFAVRIVKLYKYLIEEKRETTLSKQILRSGTSVGANCEEGAGAQTPKDFYTKFSIAYKEARETHYWIRLLSETDYINSEMTKSLLFDIDEILKILSSILATTRQQFKK